MNLAEKKVNITTEMVFVYELVKTFQDEAGKRFDHLA